MSWSLPWPYIGVKENGVTVEFNGLTVTCKNYEELVEHIKLIQKKAGYQFPQISCSSSIDFPEEYTDKPEVLEMVRRIWRWGTEEDDT